MPSARHRAAKVLFAAFVTGQVQCGAPADGPGDPAGALGTASSRERLRGPLARPGEEVTTGLYALTLEELKRCDGASPADPGSSGDRVLLGARVVVESRAPDLYVTPRDVRLRARGFVFRRQVAPRAPEACAPLLTADRLGGGERRSGYVLFDVPASQTDALRLEYEPTRWGGTGRVAIALPELAAAAADAPPGDGLPGGGRDGGDGDATARR